MNYLIPFAISLVTMLVLDGIWITTMINRLYKPGIGHLMGESVNILPAIIFYLIYAAGITYFITADAIRDNQDLLSVFVRGLILGLVAYATYDLTNQATLKDWPLMVTVADIAWGAFLTGLTSLITVVLVRKL